MKAFALSSLLPLAAAAVGAASVVLQGISQPAQAKPITPIYTNPTNDELSQNTPAGYPTPSSFGYFFDTNVDATLLTALGFPIFDGWADLPGNPTQFPQAPTFDVYVWRIDGINQPSLAPCDGSTPYCQVAKVTFDQTKTNTYIQKNGYYWQQITPVNLGVNSAASPDIQYATAAVGNFSLADGLPTLVQGTGSFDAAFSWTGNGFNVSSSYFAPPNDFSADYPVPWNFTSDPASANDPLTYFAYFSPNLSYAFVPSPLPVLGAGAAFGWARRIRRRVDPARVSALG